MNPYIEIKEKVDEKDIQPKNFHSIDVVVDVRINKNVKKVDDVNFKIVYLIGVVKDFFFDDLEEKI